MVVDEALAGASQDRKLLLFIDQFEELFSLPDNHPNAFAALLAAGARIDRLRLILTMRNEFAGCVAETPALAELFNQGVHWLLPPSWDNLLVAYQRAARRKRGCAEVAAFEYRLEDNLLALRGELLTSDYRPGSYRRFYVHEPKRRQAATAPFRDRVVHHALCQCIEPLFERAFVPDSYANRLGKGTHRALARAQQFAQCHRYALQLDVRRFFPSIDHALLRARIARRVRDTRVLGLIDLILASGTDPSEPADTRPFPGDDLLSALRPRGLPVGNSPRDTAPAVSRIAGRSAPCRGKVPRADSILLERIMNWHDYISSDPGVCHGQACIKGTRIPVAVVLDNLAAGIGEDELAASYPALSINAIRAAAAYAAELARERVVPFGDQDAA